MNTARQIIPPAGGPNSQSPRPAGRGRNPKEPTTTVVGQQSKTVHQKTTTKSKLNKKKPERTRDTIQRATTKAPRQNQNTARKTSITQHPRKKSGRQQPGTATGPPNKKSTKRHDEPKTDQATARARTAANKNHSRETNIPPRNLFPRNSAQHPHHRPKPASNATPPFRKTTSTSGSTPASANQSLPSAPSSTYQYRILPDDQQAKHHNSSTFYQTTTFIGTTRQQKDHTW